MSEIDSNLVGQKIEQLKEVSATAQDLFIARIELAKLEGQKAARQIQRLVIIMAIVFSLTLIGMILFIIVGSYAMQHWTGLHRVWWLFIIGLTTLITAFVGGWLTWSRFSREFAPLKHSLSEIQEDLAWIKEFWSTKEELDKDPKK